MAPCFKHTIFKLAPRTVEFLFHCVQRVLALQYGDVALVDQIREDGLFIFEFGTNLIIIMS